MSTTAESIALAPSISEAGEAIPFRIKYSWGAGALGVAILMNSIGTLILFYMVGVLRINPALAGTLVFASKLFGVVTDPFVGTWSYRFKARGSRRRPFLLVGSVLCAGSYALVFSTPMFAAEWARAGYVFAALLVYTCGYALYNVPYMSMPAEMTSSYHERSSIHGVRMMYVAVAGMVVGTLSPLVLERLGRTNWSSYAVVGVAGGVIILIATLIAWFGTRSARFTTNPIERAHPFAEIGHVLSNRHFMRLLAVKASQLIGIASMQAAAIFFLLNVLQRDLTVMAPVAIIATVAQLVSAPLLVNLSRRIGKSQTYIVAGLCYSLTAASWYFASPSEPLWAYFVRMAVIAVGGAGNIIMAMSMLTDIISLDAKQSGIRREGVFTAFYSFTEKFTFAFGPLVVGVALSLAGFNDKLPAEAMRTPQIHQALLVGMCYIPALMGVIAVVLLAGYKLKQDDL